MGKHSHFHWFLRVLDASMVVLDLLFVDNCATRLQGAPFLMNVKVVYYLPNCTIM